jgi:hypothetical protein
MTQDVDSEKLGKAHDYESCPVARAMQRAIGETVYVRCNTFNIKGGGFYLLPNKVQDKIRIFDNTGEMKPFDFTIEVDL